MLASKSSFLKMSTLTLTFAMVVAGCIPMRGQEAPARRAGVVDDWSHHHVVFSNPGAREEAVRNGTLDKWLRVTNSARYQMQKSRRSSGAGTAAVQASFKAGTDAVAGSSAFSRQAPALSKKTGAPVHKDWSVPMGGSAASLTATIGTLSSTTINNPGTATVKIDGVTLTASAPTKARGTLTMGANSPPNSSTLVFGGITYKFTTGTLSTTQPADTCAVRTATSRTTAMSNQIGAMTNGAHGNTGGANTWRCNSDVTADSTVTYVSNSNTGGNHSVTVDALIAGSTGITPPTVGTTGFTWAVNTAGTNGTTSGTTFAYWSGNTYLTSALVAANLATAVTANTTLQGAGGVSATSSGASLLLTSNAGGTAGNTITATATNFLAFTGGTFAGGTNATGVQPNAFPAFYGTSFTTADCANDFVVFPTGQLGSATEATIVAFNNLYSGCSGGVPSVLWALNTGAAQVTNSPVISVDGTEVAFIQSNGTNASLVVVKWAGPTGSIDSPTTPTTVSDITTCTSFPCMTVTNLAGDDTYSAPFYDYYQANDVLYVGDDNGSLEKFTGVFNGAIAGPTTINLGADRLASPVVDDGLGCVYVGDTAGYVYRVNSGIAGSVCTSTTFSANAKSALLGNGPNTGIFDGVVLDPSAGEVYAFVAASKVMGACALNNNCVVQYPTNFANAANPTQVQTVGSGAASYPLYAGTFDNVYYSAATPTGNLYVAGDTGVTTGGSLDRIPISNGVMGTPVTARINMTPSGTHPWPSPLTEFCNNGASDCVASGTATTAGTDRLFFSLNRATFTGCNNSAGNGCVLAFDISTPLSSITFLGGLPVVTPGTNGCWASGGIIIDNAAASAGASQIYFFNQNGGAAGGPNGPTSSNCTAGSPTSVNAVQASQSNP
jgi:hypothetical protein